MEFSPTPTVFSNLLQLSQLQLQHRPTNKIFNMPTYQYKYDEQIINGHRCTVHYHFDFRPNRQGTGMVGWIPYAVDEGEEVPCPYMIEEGTCPILNYCKYSHENVPRYHSVYDIDFSKLIRGENTEVQNEVEAASTEQEQEEKESFELMLARYHKEMEELARKNLQMVKKAILMKSAHSIPVTEEKQEEKESSERVLARYQKEMEEFVKENHRMIEKEMQMKSVHPIL